MGFLNKIKDILFEEVEGEEEFPQKKEVKPEVKKPIAERIEPQRSFEDNKPAMSRVNSTLREEQYSNKSVNSNNLATGIDKSKVYDDFDELEVFKPDKNFPFQDFDEKEFSAMSRAQKPKASVNVMDYEKKKRQEKKRDAVRFESREKVETVEKKKFKPSPIISPVFGVLNEDYKPEDIKDKTKENEQSNKIDFNSVRKKAFGEPEKLDVIEEKLDVNEKSVKIKESVIDKEEKIKTIDELLEDTADVTIDVKDNNHGYDRTLEEDSFDDLDDLVLGKDIDMVNEEKHENVQVDNDDLLENDLFDLIDSMYDNREDGEY